MDHHDHEDILITRRHTLDYLRQNSLRRVLGVGALWGLGTGTVIPGIYMGWNQGFAYAGWEDFLIAFGIICVFFSLLIAVMGNFTLSVPFAGGPYGFVRKGLGRIGGYAAGMAELITLMSVTAAVLVSFGDYLNYIWPGSGRMIIAAVLFLLLCLLHISGLRNAVVLQLILVCLGISAVVMFLSAPGSVPQDVQARLPATGLGVLQALPFTLWFFVCIETVTMAAEESHHPQQAIRAGLTASFLTIGVLVLMMLMAVTEGTSREALLSYRYPMLEIIRGGNQGDLVLAKVFATLSLSLILAGLGGLTVGFSRLTYALSRAGYISPVFRQVTDANMTPYMGILIPGVLVILMVWMIGQETLLFMANLSAVVVYLLIFVSGYRCGAREEKPRLRSCSLAGAGVGLVLLSAFLFHPNYHAMGILAAFAVASAGYYKVFGSGRLQAEAPEEAEAAMDEINQLVKGR